MNTTDSVEQVIAAHRVVVLHSPVTDLAHLSAALAAAGAAPRYVELGMGDPGKRAAFAALRERTGRQTLPLVFVDGTCIGGIEDAAAWAADDGGRSAPDAAFWPGYGGLVPFAVTSIATWLGLQGAASALTGYAAVILTFVGALHWGAAVDWRAGRGRVLGLSVLPALLAWLALLLPVALALPLLAIGFVVCGGCSSAAASWRRCRLGSAGYGRISPPVRWLFSSPGG